MPYGLKLGLQHPSGFGNIGGVVFGGGEGGGGGGGGMTSGTVSHRSLFDTLMAKSHSPSSHHRLDMHCVPSTMWNFFLSQHWCSPIPR